MREPFGPYVLFDRIAVGGMGEIFLAKLLRAEGFEKLVVVKRMLPHLSKSPTFIQMFQAEARIAAQLTHQNIVQIHDFGKVGDSYYIAMEPVHGVDLRTLAERANQEASPLPLSLALEIGCAVCAGLDYAHRKHDLAGAPLGIVHRDVSPQNVLVSFEGEVKLTDFGLAKAKLSAATSEAGALKGKYSYVSPEQVEGGAVDARTDLFSLGVVLFELCTGNRLFPLEESFARTLEAIRTFDATLLRARAPGLPKGVLALLEGALARDREGRFASAAAMREALEQARLEAADSVSSAPGALAAYLRALFPGEVRAAFVAIDATMVSERPIAGRAEENELSVTMLPASSRATAGEVDASVTTRDASATAKPRPRRARFLLVLAGVVIMGATALSFALGWWSTKAPSKGAPGTADGTRNANGASSAPADAAASLDLRTTPSGATIRVDGQDTRRTTPAVVSLGAGAEHDVELVLAGHEPHRWRGRASPGLRIDAELRPLRGRLEVRSRPDGAEIFIDGARVAGETPFGVSGLSYGAHRVRVALAGHRTWEREVTVDASGPGAVTATLAAAARLRITSTPSGARITIDGRALHERTPATVADLEPGARLTIIARLAGHRVERKVVSVKQRTATVDFALVPTAFVLSLSSDPVRTAALDRRPAGATPLRRRLSIGNHLVTLRDESGTSETKLLFRLTKGGAALNLDARPWAEVRFGGQAAGTVPLANHPLGSGRHHIELVRDREVKESLRLTLEREPDGAAE